MADVDLTAIARAKIHRPSTVVRLPKLHIYGRNKKGKTTFCNTAGPNQVLYADPEHGTDQMKTADPHAWPIEKWEDMQHFYEFARSGLPCPTCTPTHKFTWYSIDGLTRLSNMSLRYVMRVQEERSIDRPVGLVQKQDYGKGGELMKQMLTNFHNLNAGVIFTSQERMVEADDSEEDDDSEAAAAQYIPDLPKGVRGMVNSLVDVIGRIYVVNIDGEDGKPVPERRLWVGESLRYDTGYRSDFTLPPMIRKPTIPKLVRLINTGRATTPAAKAAATRKA